MTRVEPAPFPELPPLRKTRSKRTTTKAKAPAKSTASRKKKSKATDAPVEVPALPQLVMALPPTIADPGPAITAAPPPKKRGRKKAAEVSEPVAGPSSRPEAQASAPPPPARAKPEKRQGRFRSSAPQNILERVHRVMTQRFFMIERQREAGKLSEEFKVLGSTGNVYTVVIDHVPRCDCPDAMKGNHCKHILFVFLKVLQVPQFSGLWYQKALLTSELESIFSSAPIAPNSVSNPRLQDAYARATGKGAGKRKRGDEDEGGSSSKKRRVLTQEDDCPICYETMGGSKESDLVWCESCKNAVHDVCWKQWQTSARSSGNPVTCVYCRAKWSSSTGASSAPGKRFEGGREYVNLAGAAGLGPMHRDTSTYYRGRYGYRTYYEDDEDVYE
ncbi:hypothetical protein AX16_000845 [Volvariella volvacea WC 439]|nr:hypothetical protein AX16_000845 [Volvariella volvacea WC 439]